MIAPQAQTPEVRRRGHWRDNRWLTAVLLTLWLGATVAVVYWPASWDVVVMGWPLGFWLAAQGLLLLYLGLIVVYDWRMARIDRRWGLHESQTPSASGPPAPKGLP